MAVPSNDELQAAQPTLVFDPPLGQWLTEPTVEEVHEALLQLTPTAWNSGSGDAGLLWKGVGDLILIDSLGAGWFLSINWATGEEVFLLNPHPVTKELVGIDPGNYVELPAKYFSPFEQTWQAVAYWLQHKQQDPSLSWTTENPFPEL